MKIKRAHLVNTVSAGLELKKLVQKTKRQLQALAEDDLGNEAVVQLHGLLTGERKSMTPAKYEKLKDVGIVHQESSLSHPDKGMLDAEKAAILSCVEVFDGKATIFSARLHRVATPPIPKRSR